MSSKYVISGRSEDGTVYLSLPHRSSRTFRKMSQRHGKEMGYKESATQEMYSWSGAIDSSTKLNKSQLVHYLRLAQDDRGWVHGIRAKKITHTRGSR